jgi:hypothetical protein
LGKIIWTDSVRNAEVLHVVKKERNILCTKNRTKANWIGHTFYRNCFLKDFTEGKIEGTGSRRKILKQLMNNLTEKRKYWNLRLKALDRTVV